jgi:hypothetical protein
MTKRPIPILLTMTHHVLALAYMASQLRRAFPITDYSSGQLFAFAFVALALVLLFVRPNLGRWVSFGVFATGGLVGCFFLFYFLLQSVPGHLLLPMAAFNLVFLALAYALAFGKSTKTYIAQLREDRLSPTAAHSAGPSSL